LVIAVHASFIDTDSQSAHVEGRLFERDFAQTSEPYESAAGTGGRLKHAQLGRGVMTLSTRISAVPQVDPGRRRELWARWQGGEARARIIRRRENIGALMRNNAQSSDGVITKPSGTSVAQTIDGLKRVIADRGFTVFNVIDHRGVAERAGVQMPDSKLVMLGKPAVGAGVMVAAPLAALDIPLKVLVWEDENGAVWVSYNSPEFLSERHHLEGELRAPFDAVASIVEAVVGP
jgi:uncharacterized protein (DUF302 family)